MTENTSFILAEPQMGFGPYGPEDELLHPQMNAKVDHDGATETQYFGFNVPEENIHGYGYFWHHPKLGTVTGGVQAWRGSKAHHLASEIYDIRAYQKDSYITDNIDHHKMPCSYQVDVIKPFEELRIQYRDDARDNAIDITYTALAPPAMLPDRKHFEQIMKTRGSITLRGKTYAVDGYNVRDRSWGEVRPQEPVAFPPSVWLTGVFGDDLAFNFMGTDHPSTEPDWQSVYQIPDEASLKGGWVYHQGKYSRVVSAVKSTQRDPQSLVPLSHELELTDEKGQVFQLNGTVTSSAPTGFWANGKIEIALTRWTCNGPGINQRTGWGDSQEVQWTDFVYAMHNRGDSD